MSGTPLPPEAGAAVIGGGPAGLSAALGLARAGFAVRLFEQSREWTGRVCGAFLNPAAAGHLRWLGVWDSLRSGGARVSHAALFAEGERISEIPLGGRGLALPRRDLEETLLEKAAESGVQVERGTRVQALSRRREGYLLRLKRAALPEEDFACALIVCADGRFSKWRRKRPESLRGDGWLGWNVEFEDAGRPPGELSLHFFPGGYAGTLAFREGTLNVSGLIRQPAKEKMGSDWAAFFERVVGENAGLRRMLRRARQAGPFRGVAALPFGCYLDEGEDLFLAGDAAAVCDPWMGEGIERALGAGPMLAQAFEGSSDVRRARRRYVKLWKERYGARPAIGSPLRRLMPGRFWTPFVLKALSHAPLRQALLKRIHGPSEGKVVAPPSPAASPR